MKFPVKIQLKQVLGKLKKDHIIVMILEERMKLNILGSQVLDIFDFVFHTQKLISSPLTYKKLHSTLGFDISCLLDQLNVKNIQNIINVDSVAINDFKCDANNKIEQSKLNPDYFQQKLPISVTNDTICRIINIYVQLNFGITLQLAQIIQKIVQMNRNISMDEFVTENNLKEVNLREIINTSIEENLTLLKAEFQIKEIENLKNEIRLKNKNLDPDCNLILETEKRVENLRNQMIDHIKKMSLSKISNMHFIIGDVIVRNIPIFKAHESSKFFSEKNRNIITKIQKVMNEQQEVREQPKNQNHYYFYFYAE